MKFMEYKPPNIKKFEEAHNMMNIKAFYLTALAFSLTLGFSGTASADLENNGGGLIYDSTQNITWTQDANLLGTLETNAIITSGSDSGLIQQIINANSGVVTGPSNSSWTLSANDFGSGGLVDWYGAQAFVGYLNSKIYDGSTQWSLPITPNYGACTNCGNQLPNLFNELGGVAGSPMPSGPFNNVQVGYWSNATNGDFDYAYNFQTNGTLRAYSASNLANYAWAVSPGDLAPVPIPGAIWLFGSVLVGFLGFNRRKTFLQ